LLCVSRLTSIHMQKYYPNHTEHRNSTFSRWVRWVLFLTGSPW
jgi:hypothetical protein